jgi:metal-responsive CopG/Arc/MetJ family transcriptional regulator
MPKKERTPILLKCPDELLKKIKEYQQKEMISTRAGAIYELIRLGLKYAEKERADSFHP